MIFEQATFTSSAPTTAAATSTTEQYVIAQEGKGMIGSVFTHLDRQNLYSSYYWTSSGPWTTYTNYNANADNSLIQFVNMALGDGMGSSGSSQLTWFNESERESARVVQWAYANRVGHARDVYHASNSTSSPGHTFRILPVRNISGGAISVSFNTYASNYWGSGYEGNALFVLSPSAPRYSAPGTITSTLLAAVSSTNSPLNNLTGTFSIPAYTTVLVCLASTDFYMTTSRFRDTNFFLDLNTTTFSNPNIICDMRMLSSLAYSRFNLPQTGTAVNTTLLAPLWTMTATNFGDR